LATFIREKNLSTLDDMITQAEAYRLARPGKPVARKSQANVFASVVKADVSQAAVTGFVPRRGFGRGWKTRVVGVGVRMKRTRKGRKG
jgi:hypothetical protein